MPASEPEPVKPVPPPEQEEQIITQDSEETPVIEDVKDIEPQEEVIEPPVEEQEEPIEEEPEPEPEPVVNPNALYKGKSESTQTSNEGITGDPGDQGKPTGTKDTRIYDGPGGVGDGISFSLAGRQAKQLPKPEYRSEEQGKIIVTIWVDRFGNVTRAEPGARGTNISDLNLREMAKKAALKAKFSPDPDAPEVQKGTITYNFIKMN
jgi:outer membrane biosynthesis protein TonB